MKFKGSVIDFANGYSIGYRTTLNRLAAVVPFNDAVISTTLPRGGLQITQPRGTDAARMRQYVREAHIYDIVAWEAIRRNRPVTLSQVLQGSDSPHAEAMAATAYRLRREFLQPSGLAHYVAVPLEGPTLTGFPGALHLYRATSAGDFRASELEQLQAVGQEFDRATTQMHAARGDDTKGQQHRYRQCAYSMEGLVFPDAPPGGFDPELLTNLASIIQERLERCAPKMSNAVSADAEVDGEFSLDDGDSPYNGSNADRLLIPGAKGDNWTFRLAMFDRFPAINRGREGAVAVVSLQPECETWSMLRPSDFAADDDIARLIPALQYMQENYTSGSNLSEIARTVHLSPFHFHRRFTDLLGITPKHFLFDCQIAEAKRQLARKERSLAEIARHTGFAHQSHFTSRFKQATNLTPTKWRRQVVEEE